MSKRPEFSEATLRALREAVAAERRIFFYCKILGLHPVRDRAHFYIQRLPGQPAQIGVFL